MRIANITLCAIVAASCGYPRPTDLATPDASVACGSMTCEPPSPTCVNASTLRTYGATCSAAGDCVYTPRDTPCTGCNAGPPPSCTSGCIVSTTNFSFTGALQQYVVPSGAYAVRITVAGAQGADGIGGFQPASGGRGATAIGTLAVTPGQALVVTVGGTNGFNGGGAGVSAGPSGSGGGASDVRTGAGTLAERVIVAGGGGGGGSGSSGVQLNACSMGQAGAGGAAGPGGVAGAESTCDNGATAVVGGAGGTATAGGSGGDGGGTGASGASGIGGRGGAGLTGDGYHGGGGGGGGGGYFGGGGGAGGFASAGSIYPGASAGGGGGGGSSFTGTLSDAAITADAHNGDGTVVITTLCQ